MGRFIKKILESRKLIRLVLFGGGYFAYLRWILGIPAIMLDLILQYPFWSIVVIVVWFVATNALDRYEEKLKREHKGRKNKD